MAKDAKRILTLTGVKTYVGPATGKKNLLRGEQIEVDDETAERLLTLSGFDASNNEHFYFTEGAVNVTQRGRVTRQRSQAAA